MEAYLIVGIATSGWIASNSDERLGIADVALIALMWPLVFAAIASRGK
jgi:hypothetical protein